jgi:hypothetical protein
MALSDPAEKLPPAKYGIDRIQKHSVVTDVVLVQKMGIGTKVGNDMNPGADRPGGFESATELTGQPPDLEVIVPPSAQIFSSIHQIVQIVLWSYQQLVDRCDRGLSMWFSQFETEGRCRTTRGTDGLDSGGPVKPNGIRRPRVHTSPSNVWKDLTCYPAGEGFRTWELAAEHE